DGQRVSNLVYYGVPGNKCPAINGLRITLVGYKLPQTGTVQGNRIDLVYEDASSRLELAGTVGRDGAEGTVHAVVQGCDLGLRPWTAARFGGRAGAAGGKAPRTGLWAATDRDGHAALTFQVHKRKISNVRVVSFMSCKDTTETSLN